MKRKLLFIAVCLLGFYSAGAQQSRTLTLKEAIDLTLANSKQLKLSEAKILEASNAVKEAEEKRLPDAGISGSYLYLPVNPNIDLKTGGSGSGSGGGGTPSVHQAVYGIASVAVPVYNAGKLKYGIESANYLQQAVKLDADNDRQGVIYNTINACINLFKAHQAIELISKNLEQSKQRVTDFTNLEKNGLIARNDLLKAQLQSANVELSLLDAQSNYKLACVNMNLMMGLPEQTELVPDKTGLALPESVKTLEEYEQDALQNRNDIAAVGLRKKAADVNIKTIKTEYYPSLSLSGGYVAADIPKFLSITNAVNIGVGVKYNVSSLWKTKTKLQNAEVKLKEIQLNQDLLSDNIRLQINQAYQAYLVSVKKVQVLLESVDQATENYRITKNKYDNTLATITELLDADVAKLQSQLSVTNAKADSFLAYNRILYAAGILKF